ncbi:AarF/UbiB family protein [Actinosynnema sp. NPDC050436]|uniref:ABC1 kinase family protein n=1 Tax=Actinosynnema sp. NPDC050436 TaxID=3155659 RepID=UPI0033C79867
MEIAQESSVVRVPGHRSRVLAGLAGTLAAGAISRKAGSGSRARTVRERARARAVRLALESLGPFYIKMGQMLATRPDLVSDIMICELENLHDNVVSAPFLEFADILDRDIPTWRQRFRSIDVLTPLGSASLAQVYRVTMSDGTLAVVKIQRPRIRSVVLEDMKRMRRVARLIGRLAPKFNELIDVDATLRVMFNGMEPELDFTLEAQNMVAARRAVKEFKHLTVPKVIDATPRVLVQTLAPGVSIGVADPAAFSKKQRKGIGRDLLSFMYRGYFTEHVFHADPHPGNILVHPGRKASVIDWGMVGRIDRNLGATLVLILLAITKNDSQATARSWVEMGRATHRADLQGFASDLSMLIPRIASSSLEELNFGITLTTILAFATRRGIHTSPHVSLLGKSFANAEGSVRKLAPELSMAEVFEDAVVEILADLFADFFSKEQAGRFALEIMMGGNAALTHLRGIVNDLHNRQVTLRIGLLEGSGYQNIKQNQKLTHLGLGVLLALVWFRVRNSVR